MLTGLINLAWLAAAVGAVCFLAHGLYLLLRFLFADEGLKHTLSQLAYKDSPRAGFSSKGPLFAAGSVEV